MSDNTKIGSYEHTEGILLRKAKLGASFDTKIVIGDKLPAESFNSLSIEEDVKKAVTNEERLAVIKKATTIGRVDLIPSEWGNPAKAILDSLTKANDDGDGKHKKPEDEDHEEDESLSKEAKERKEGDDDSDEEVSEDEEKLFTLIDKIVEDTGKTPEAVIKAIEAGAEEEIEDHDMDEDEARLTAAQHIVKKFDYYKIAKKAGL